VCATSTTALAVTTDVSVTAGMPTSSMPATCASLRGRRRCRERHKCEGHDRNHSDRKFAKHTSPFKSKIVGFEFAGDRVDHRHTLASRKSRRAGQENRTFLGFSL
jgi:hypothetical protein